MEKPVTNPRKKDRVRMSDIPDPSPLFVIFDQWRDQWDKKKVEGGK